MQTVTLNIPALGNVGQEAFKTLRTNLQFCGKDIRCITITSCEPDEGKSTICLNLARTMADSGKRVLFIDADMRKSVLISRLKVGQSIKGLSHYLSGQESFNEVVCSTNVRNLHIIFAGPIPPNPSELLGGNTFRAALDKLKTIYDYIIIDTPPLGSVIDAAVIANECDGSALVISQNHISRVFAKKVVDQLNKADCPVLGVILNKVNMSNGFYGKYYGKYYGKGTDKYLND